MTVLNKLIKKWYKAIMNSVQPTTPTDSSGNELINKNNQQGNIVGDGTQQRVLTGFQKDGFGDGKDYGIKVSQEGYDVRTASDDQLVMSSGFNMFKITDSGTTTLTAVTGSGVAITVDHNLGRVPAVIAFANTSQFGSNAYSPLNFVTFSSATIYCTAVMLARENDIYFNVDVGSGASSYSGLWTIKYYILQETAN